MKKLFNTFTAICLFSFGMVAFAGPEAGRLEVKGGSDLILNLLTDSETEYENSQGSTEMEETGYSFDIAANYYLDDQISVGFALVMV